MANPPGNTLVSIQQKVRRLTRSPSTTQLTDDDLNNYINTFVVYDFPEHLRMFNLRTTFTFIANPYQSTYYTDEVSFAGATNNPLYNFQNTHISVHPPFYVAGYQTFYTQSREQFFGIYPMVNNIQQVSTGDGITTTFTGVVPIISQSYNSNLAGSTLLQNEVLFSSVSTNNEGLALVDVPVVDTTTGNQTTIGNLYVPGFEPSMPPTTVTPTNTINYVTGAFTITFPSAPQSGAQINSQTVPTVTTRPQGILYYDNTFVLRPVPDQPYRINFETYVRPTYLMNTNSTPQLEEWWQYIAYGAAKKIFEDRMDLDSVQLIMPEYKKQEALCLRRTIVQYTNERTATIYTEQTGTGGTGSWGWNGSNF